MKFSMILVSMLFAGSVFAQDPHAAPTAPAGDEMSTPAPTEQAPAKPMKHKKKAKHKKNK
ncbi:MAG: hypothetical protein KF802_14025 [Bdellovibrionaceae bacterium]|nr:hypothetical protein [Pseudobdellovibrionaceae bacterium]MBX3033147.1 hypothetical protein [Pseudobdellovibrionaceae bacterium]